jgi:hypothetical protein
MRITRYDACDFVSVSWEMADSTSYDWYYRASTKSLVGVALSKWAWMPLPFECSANDASVFAGEFPRCAESSRQVVCPPPDAGEGGAGSDAGCPADGPRHCEYHPEDGGIYVSVPRIASEEFALAPETAPVFGRGERYEAFGPTRPHGI